MHADNPSKAATRSRHRVHLYRSTHSTRCSTNKSNSSTGPLRTAATEETSSSEPDTCSIRTSPSGIARTFWNVGSQSAAVVPRDGRQALSRLSGSTSSQQPSSLGARRGHSADGSRRTRDSAVKARRASSTAGPAFSIRRLRCRRSRVHGSPPWTRWSRLNVRARGIIKL